MIFFFSCFFVLQLVKSKVKSPQLITVIVMGLKTKTLLSHVAIMFKKGLTKKTLVMLIEKF